MLDILKQKMLSWTPETANTFYANLPRKANFTKIVWPNVVWETTSTGYFLISPDYTAYYDYNGRSYSLMKGDFVAGLEAKRELAEYAELNNGIRVEKPAIMQLVDVYSLPYTYCEEYKPYGTHGIPFENLLQVPSEEFQNTIKDAIKNLLKSFDSLIASIDTLNVDREVLLNYPDSPSFINLLYDPAVEKFFWAGRIDFTVTREEFFNNLSSYNFISRINSFVQKNFLTSVDIQSEITDFVSTECTTLQPLI